MKKIILIVISFLAFPVIASASVSWATREEGSHFFIEGECLKDKMKIEFFEKAEDKDPAYDTDIQCENGQFAFSGNLLKKKLDTGNYVLAIDGEKSQNIVSVRNEEYGKVGDIKNPVVQPVALPDPDVKFLGALAGFEQSILDMQTWLSETRYSKVIKESVSSILDGITALSGKIADLLWEADSMPASSGEDELTETENENILLQDVAEKKEPVAPLTIDEAVALPTDGLTVSNSQESAKPVEEFP